MPSKYLKIGRLYAKDARFKRTELFFPAYKGWKVPFSIRT